MKDYVFKKDGETIAAVVAEDIADAYAKAEDILKLDRKEISLLEVFAVEDDRITELEEQVKFLMDQECGHNKTFDQEGNYTGIKITTFKELYEQYKK